MAARSSQDFGLLLARDGERALEILFRFRGIRLQAT